MRIRNEFLLKFATISILELLDISLTYFVDGYSATKTHKKLVKAGYVINLKSINNVFNELRTRISTFLCENGIFQASVADSY